MKKALPAYFDPFNDRLARDIRNTLSVAFAEALGKRQLSRVRSVAEKWLDANPVDLYSDYIHDRLRRYQCVFEQIEKNRIDDGLLQALVVWNNGLFFEFHEHLERIWHQSTGDQHRALQGLIQAAGVYIHLESGHLRAAAGLSARAQVLLRSGAHCLAFITNLELLLDKLDRIDPTAPRLENPVLQPKQAATDQPEGPL